MKSEYYEEKYNGQTSDQNNTTSNYHANNVPDSDDDDLKYQSYKPGPTYKTQQNDIKRAPAYGVLQIVDKVVPSFIFLLKKRKTKRKKAFNVEYNKYKQK